MEIRVEGELRARWVAMSSALWVPVEGQTTSRQWPSSTPKTNPPLSKPNNNAIASRIPNLLKHSRIRKLRPMHDHRLFPIPRPDVSESRHIGKLIDPLDILQRQSRNRKDPRSNNNQINFNRRLCSGNVVSHMPHGWFFVSSKKDRHDGGDFGAKFDPWKYTKSLCIVL